MTSQKQSASTPSFASTVLPHTNVIVLPTAKRNALQSGTFTKTSISRMHCPQGNREALFWDASCRGFGLRALSSGRRSWIFQYRDEHKRTRRIALGDVSAVSLEVARQAARQHAAGVTQGAILPRIGRRNKAHRASSASSSHICGMPRPISVRALLKKPSDTSASMRYLSTTIGRRRLVAPTSPHCLIVFRRPPGLLPLIVYGRRSVRFGLGGCGLGLSSATATQ